MNDISRKNQKEYLMYMHAGSLNHGCEAIVRSLCSMLYLPCALLSNHPEEDDRVNLQDVCRIMPVKHYEQSIFLKTRYYLHRKFTHRADAQMRYAYSGAAPFTGYRMALSIGGDNYCYSDALVNLKGANELFEAESVPTALVGCSVEPDILKDKSVVDDLSRYSLIIARESVSYEALRMALPTDRAECVHLLPDPAFALSPRACDLPAGFKEGHTIGLNISPMIMNYAPEGDSGIVMANYRTLIETVINETHDVIALIPHVTTSVSDDRVPMRVLYNAYKDTGRVIMVEDKPAEELKYIISRCRLLITARTHASIAAYSTYVPTLVVGYSVKAGGIAKDLFGSADGYVCSVQDLKTASDLTDAYTELEARSVEQRDTLKDKIPGIISDSKKAAKILAK